MKNFPKAVKIVLINAILTVTVILLFDLFMYAIVLSHTNIYAPHYLTRPEFSLQNIQNGKLAPFRKTCGLKYNKKPIIIYGCSYAYGYKLNENEQVGHLLSEMTKRPVYNFSVSAGGFQQTLYLLQNQQPITPEPEYIMYVFIQDHIRRMYMDSNINNMFRFMEYKNKSDGFKLEKGLQHFLKNSVIYQYIIRCFVYHRIDEEDNFRLAKQYLAEIKKEINLKYPHSKFIFIIYDKQNDISLNFSKEKQQEIKDLGIEVLDLDDIFGDKLYQKEYQMSETDTHPNAKAWEFILPKLVKVEKL